MVAETLRRKKKKERYFVFGCGYILVLLFTSSNVFSFVTFIISANFSKEYSVLKLNSQHEQWSGRSESDIC